MLFFIAILIVALMVSMFESRPARYVYILILVVLALMPFHAFLTVWLASMFGHYTELRLWKELLLGMLLLLSYFLLFRDRELRQWLWRYQLLRLLLILITLYILLHLALGALAFIDGRVTLRGLGYGLISNLRYLIFFKVCVLAAYYCKDRFAAHWQRLLLWPAAVVIGIGLLQFVILPPDVLRHFGYGPDTVAPYIAVDQKVEYARLQSTLRGPNPLGAYLVVVVPMLVALFMKRQKNYFGWGVAVFLSLVVLYGTYSRSAWIGVVVALFVFAWVLSRAKVRKILLIAAAGVVLLGAGLLVGLRDNNYVQNVLFHTDENSRASNSSNEDRASAIMGGIEHIAQEPLGRGPGTAGPASVYNKGQVRIAENYFIQIGQEVGFVGMALFAAICAVAGVLLWKIKNGGVLPVVLIASLCGLTAVNLVSHAWADDALAYIWWGLAGLAIGTGFLGLKDGAGENDVA